MVNSRLNLFCRIFSQVNNLKLSSRDPGIWVKIFNEFIDPHSKGVEWMGKLYDKIVNSDTKFNLKSLLEIKILFCELSFVAWKIF